MSNQNSHRFIFLPYQIKKKQEIIFNYELNHDSKKILFQEKIILPKPFSQGINKGLFSEVLNSLSLILAISYWKTFCPKQIILTNYQLTKKQANFWNTVYTKGLGEFFYKNRLDFRSLVSFPYSKRKKRPFKQIKINNQRSILGLGGGKDSIVAVELLKKQKKDFSLFVLYHQKKPSIIKEVAKVINKPVIWIERIIDPQLFKLNKKRGVYKGHVPFNAILSFVALLIAIIYDFSEIITANEREANEGNLFYLGEEVNHQWSKSEKYEDLFNQYIKEVITSKLHYYSILRSMDELKIAKEFSQYLKYFPYFSSCNSNFKIGYKQKDYRWCNQCSKCLFTFLVLAPFIKKETMVKIFRQNLLQKKELLRLYQQLLGLKGNKPFECVGTKETVIKASSKLAQTSVYQNDFLIKFFKERYAV